MNHNAIKTGPPSLPSELVLKLLPNNIEYAFLREGDTLLVVISSKLETTQKEVVVKLLKEYKRGHCLEAIRLEGN